MIASLPMYDRPETAGANDRLWTAVAGALRDHGIDAPATLDRRTGLWEAWLSPDLLLSQSCSFPYRTRLHGKVGLVATPVLDLPDAPPGHYYSVLVARRADPRRTFAEFAGATLAINDPASQSGWAAPHAQAAAEGVAFGRVVETGAHRASARAVADGRADIAALDALSWRIMRAWDDGAADLKVVDRTDPTPALPFITALHRDPAPIAEALDAAIAALSAVDRDRLGLLGTVRLDAAAYLAVPTPPPPVAEPAPAP